MSLSLVIAINVIADISLLAGLAHVMSRAARLTPHVAAVQATPAEQQVISQRRSTRASRQTTRSGASIPSPANA